MHRLALGLFLLLAALLASGCTIEVTLEGKRCAADGSCPSGLFCDTSQNVCASEPVPADWTDLMVAVYRFDDAASLGLDATSAHRDLEVFGSPRRLTDEPPRGEGYLLLERGDHLQIVDEVFASGENKSFTFGGWFRLDGTADRDRLVNRYLDEQGYALSFDGTKGAVACELGASGHSSPAGSVAADEPWFHAVCRMEAFAERVTNVLDGLTEEDDLGTPLASGAVGNPGDDYPFTISHPEPDRGFVGAADEIFFVNRDLGTKSIRRIYACGLDGRACRCDPADPAAYLDCGPVAVCATDLPPCNQAQPETAAEER